MCKRHALGIAFWVLILAFRGISIFRVEVIGSKLMLQ
jgi:hypothetical protein